MDMMKQLFGREKAMIGMVHVGALPGTPNSEKSIDTLLVEAVRDANALAQAGFDAIIVENMHDVPYLRREVGPEIIATMTVLTRAVRESVDCPMGVQVLAGDNHAALAVALAADAQFIRAEGFAFASVADEGILDRADAGPLLRYRRAVGGDSIAIFADVLKKHSAHALTSDLSIEDQIDAHTFMGADGIVITGNATGKPVDLDQLAVARAASDLPLLVGSGATAESLGALFAHADGIIVGSAAKHDGDWRKSVDQERAAHLINAARKVAP